MMARDVVSHLMMKFFFKDQVKNKSKTTRVKDEFLKDMNFTLMSGTVTKATKYLQDISETDQVSEYLTNVKFIESPCASFGSRSDNKS